MVIELGIYPGLTQVTFYLGENSRDLRKTEIHAGGATSVFYSVINSLYIVLYISLPIINHSRNLIDFPLLYV